MASSMGTFFTEEKEVMLWADQLQDAITTNEIANASQVREISYSVSVFVAVFPFLSSENAMISL